MMLSNIFGPKMEEIRGCWRKLQNGFFFIVCIACKITLEFADKGGRDGRGVWHVWEARENCK